MLTVVSSLLVVAHLFGGATLCATGVGARVFQDLGRPPTPEARVILRLSLVRHRAASVTG